MAKLYYEYTKDDLKEININAIRNIRFLRRKAKSNRRRILQTIFKLM